MKNLSRHIGKLEIVRRENNSVNGNPRYLCRIDGWTCYTAPDSSLAYALPNYEGKTVIATIGTYYGRPTINTLESAQ